VCVFVCVCVCGVCVCVLVCVCVCVGGCVCVRFRNTFRKINYRFSLQFVAYTPIDTDRSLSILKTFS